MHEEIAEKFELLSRWPFSFEINGFTFVSNRFAIFIEFRFEASSVRYKKKKRKKTSSKSNQF